MRTEMGNKVNPGMPLRSILSVCTHYFHMVWKNKLSNQNSSKGHILENRRCASTNFCLIDGLFYYFYWR